VDSIGRKYMIALTKAMGKADSDCVQLSCARCRKHMAQSVMSRWRCPRCGGLLYPIVTATSLKRALGVLV